MGEQMITSISCFVEFRPATSSRQHGCCPMHTPGTLPLFNSVPGWHIRCSLGGGLLFVLVGVTS